MSTGSSTAAASTANGSATGAGRPGDDAAAPDGGALAWPPAQTRLIGARLRRRRPDNRIGGEEEDRSWRAVSIDGDVDVRTSDFDYELPKELIAQYPAERRDESRLLVLRREDGSVEHRVFREFVEYVRPGDVLVVNETAVIPARFLGRKRESGGRAEMFLLRELAPARWEALVRPGARIREGTVLEFGLGELTARVGETLEGGKREVELSVGEARGAGKGSRSLPGGDASRDAALNEKLRAVLDELGSVPLPPYIEREAEDLDRERYQTVYSRVRGAVAAPTAGLHFTERTITDVEARGASVAKIILHVGLGTFRPVAHEDPSEHEMDEERYEVSSASASVINAARERGGRIVAVGTTSVRVLETVGDDDGRVHSGEGATRLFIRPPYSFKAVDALITNFHLPRSTLLMLVSALGGRDKVLAAYREAVIERYRFYSYGDAMLIL